jgi:hypothetical protein
LGDCGDGHDIVEGEPVSGVRLDPVLGRKRSAVTDPLQLRRTLLAFRMGITPSMKLDDGSAKAQRSFDLAFRWLDEQADANACASELIDEISEMVVLPCGVQSAFSRTLLTPLRHDTRGVRPMPQRNLEHFLGRRHLQVQRQVDLIHQPVDVIVGDVPAILAKMRGNAVGTRIRGHDGSAHRIGMIAAARVPDGRDVIDIDA